MPTTAANPDDSPLLLTVNNRLAQELHRRHDQQQAASGKTVWPTPDITPWSAWLRRSYEQLVDTGFTQRVLLNPHQERLLWERVVRKSSQGDILLRPAAAARTAQQTWQLVNDWQLEREQLLALASDETRIYLDWQQAFLRICDEQQLISAAELTGLLIAAAGNKALECKKHIRLAGFDTLSPAQSTLLDLLRTQGVQIDDGQSLPQQGEKTRLELADKESEIRAAARWAKAFTAQNPDVQVAIVSPRLEQQRETLLRICTEVISPHNLLPGNAKTHDFNLSLGQPLADYPLVAHLLLALKLGLNQPLPANAISTLLRSPFLGGHSQEWSHRAQLDFKLRDDGLPQLDLSRLLYRAQQFDDLSSAHTPLLVERLKTLTELLAQLPRDDTPNAWAGHLLHLIECLGWPGDQALDSSEFQQAAKLRESISSFSSLSRVQHSMQLPEVIHRLTQLCEETVFQPQAGVTRIQVLGVLEAAGMRFDAIWLLGMDDQAWPPSASPNPLLPTRLQRELGMPHASSERELQFARHLTNQLFSCAPRVFISHAAKDGDREQRPSPLTGMIPLAGNLPIGCLDEPDELSAAAMHLGPTDNLPAPQAVPPQESPEGGSGLLSDQAACPFRAVARHRLKANPLPETSAAPSPMLLGNMVHDLLKRVWDEIQTAEQLRSLDDDALLALVEPHAKNTLLDLGRHRPDIFTDTFIKLEIQRLCELLSDWLRLEQQRALPFRVLRTEEKQQVKLGGLSLRLRADRVDQLADGRLVIIDYKTGEQADARGWLDPRPTELQVPLYCVEAEQPPAAALIARIHARSTVFRGRAQDDNIAPGIPAFEGDETIGDWQQLLAHWHHALHELAAEILSGRADIQPQDEKACTFCELGPLCRISSLNGHSPTGGSDA